jgi:hypothetical protein
MCRSHPLTRLCASGAQCTSKLDRKPAGPTVPQSSLWTVSRQRRQNAAAFRGFDAHKRVKGHKRHILVDTFGLQIACRVEPADISDRKAAAPFLGGLEAIIPEHSHLSSPMPDTKVVRREGEA